ncbi:glycosyltransferase family A protein [Peribacillus sp. NPDC096622]|uniref:glycosyltransferase family A protein n=1 Tax=Peribacillus sp. NPDC096622 TaxID=3364396 RepID=UPI003818BB36
MYISSSTYFEKENGGTSSVLNLRSKNASGEYFAWLNSDDHFNEDKVSKQITFMRKQFLY